ncbi:uncharacterized protein L969DRAFT_83920 [Mixia osmundae IAM 14324]|uniref:General transcription and DNA repair factor IIH n=1 Tax=Mixia osmundae (strain CBS 9802 / IAM 14324 / JCM 22182 / KY 12970) TaxID=764103 RepID=G7DVA8_MIXOS|nr:uncharacterized protein L969DRAFT_83920 [Mixia osmundae IAM 14324]KEI42059.1 hypothetical protein L969DRAFT_83920 [Mixia osmundae IAM 14324]GAA94518.1 hypothetical protein E5Q_01170 [Mixia osmundae IAM 14324]
MDSDDDYDSVDSFIDDEEEAGRSFHAQKGAKGKAAQGKANKRRKTANGTANGEANYSWEEDYKRSWDVVREDERGSLQGAVKDILERSKRRRIMRDTTSIQRGIIRHLYFIIDLSEAMTDRDLRPTRLELTIKYAIEFVNEYFDQNPISQMAILVTKDGIAERISPLSGNPVDHVRALESKRKLDPSGEPSLQNVLEMARSGLAHLPSHGSREVVIIFGSLTTCDPGNIHTTMEALVKDRVRVNIVGLSAEMSICKEVCKRTKGVYGVVTNEAHYKDLLFELVPPPATHRPEAGPDGSRSNNTGADLMQMGFPSLSSSTFGALCSCHSRLKTTGFNCPRCASRLCEVPTECGICSLTVVSSPHLARSYRHLFPVKNYLEVNNGQPGEDSWPAECFACSLKFSTVAVSAATTGAPPTAASTASRISSTGRYECPRCHNHFCIDCDLHAHEVLGVCPGCL